MSASATLPAARRAGLVAAGLLAAATAVGPAGAARWDAGAAAAPRGPALSQRFLSEAVSILRSEAGTACVASAPIDIAASRYVGADGASVAFEAVRRSRAASVQLVHPVGPAAGAPFLRVQLKYPVDAAAPPTLAADGVAAPVGGGLEPSGDSLRLDDPALLERLRMALSGDDGEAVLTGVSADTGRRIEDRLPALDLAGLADCVEAVDAAAATAGRPPRRPEAGLSVTFDAAPTPETRVSAAAARACGMGGARGAVHRARLSDVTGFFAQTGAALAVFDPSGRLRRLHVPGVFDAALAAPDAARPLDAAEALETAVVADVSLAADRNDPLGTAAVKGCLGASATTLCLRPAGAGRHAVGPCVTGAAPTAVGPSPADLAQVAAATPPSTGLFGGGRGTPGGGARRSPPTRGGEAPDEPGGRSPRSILTPITMLHRPGLPPEGPPPGTPPTEEPPTLTTPLPGALPGLVLALGALAALRRRRRG